MAERLIPTRSTRAVLPGLAPLGTRGRAPTAAEAAHGRNTP